MKFMEIEFDWPKNITTIQKDLLKQKTKNSIRLFSEELIKDIYDYSEKIKGSTIQNQILVHKIPSKSDFYSIIMNQFTKTYKYIFENIFEMYSNYELTEEISNFRKDMIELFYNKLGISIADLNEIRNNISTLLKEITENKENSQKKEDYFFNTTALYLKDLQNLREIVRRIQDGGYNYNPDDIKYLSTVRAINQPGNELIKDVRIEEILNTYSSKIRSLEMEIKDANKKLDILRKIDPKFACLIFTPLSLVLDKIKEIYPDSETLYQAISKSFGPSFFVYYLDHYFGLKDSKVIFEIRDMIDEVKKEAYFHIASCKKELKKELDLLKERIRLLGMENNLIVAEHDKKLELKEMKLKIELQKFYEEKIMFITDENSIERQRLIEMNNHHSSHVAHLFLLKWRLISFIFKCNNSKQLNISKEEIECLVGMK